MWIIEWYMDLPPLLRFLLALGFLVWGGVELFVFGVFRPWSWGLGVVFLVFALPRSGERNKWGDW